MEFDFLIIFEEEKSTINKKHIRIHKEDKDIIGSLKINNYI